MNREERIVHSCALVLIDAILNPYHDVSRQNRLNKFSVLFLSVYVDLNRRLRSYAAKIMTRTQCISQLYPDEWFCRLAIKSPRTG